MLPRGFGGPVVHPRAWIALPHLKRILASTGRWVPWRMSISSTGHGVAWFLARPDRFRALLNEESFTLCGRATVFLPSWIVWREDIDADLAEFGRARH